MNIRTIFIAAAIAAIPVISPAATVVPICDSSGAIAGSYNISTFDIFNCNVALTTDPANGVLTWDFYATDRRLTIAVTSNLGLAGDTFTSAALSWWDDGGALISSVALVPFGAPATFGFQGQVSTLFNFDTRTLKLEWAGFTGKVLSVNVLVAAVPLPAGALLLITGLAGLGLSRRRKRKS